MENRRENFHTDDFYSCTVHFDICRVHSSTNALFSLKNTLKFT